MKIIREFHWKIKQKELKQLKLIILDVDGVLTDGRLTYDFQGNIQKTFNVKDGLGIKILSKIGLQVAFLSGGAQGATNNRANDLGIKICLTGIKDKSKALLNLQKQFSLKKNEIAYIGDDLNDLVTLPYVGLLIAPSDASKPFLKKAHLILNNKGGSGAIREFADRILKSNSLWKNYCKSGWKELN